MREWFSYSLGGDPEGQGLSGHELVLKCSPKLYNPVRACQRERVFVGCVFSYVATKKNLQIQSNTTSNNNNSSSVTKVGGTRWVLLKQHRNLRSWESQLKKTVTLCWTALTPLIFLHVSFQDGICWSSDCMCGPWGPRSDRGDRVLRGPTLESVLLHWIQHCDCTGNGMILLLYQRKCYDVIRITIIYYE